MGAASDTRGNLSVRDNNEYSTPGRAALRAKINQETGEIEVGVATSSARLDAELENALRRDTEGLKQVFHPDGSVSVNLEGRFQNVYMTHIDENGRRVVCTDHHDHAADTLTNSRSTDTSGRSQTPEVR
jgi:hypothetical protein